jgi:hypothetical protein
VSKLYPCRKGSSARYLWVAGENDAAIAILESLPADTPGLAYDLAMIHASMGRNGEAADLLEASPPAGTDSEIVKEAVRRLRAAPADAASPQDLPQLGSLDWVYLYTGAPERALDWHERNLSGGFPGGAAIAAIWHSSYAPLRRTERFKTYVRKLGLAEYWRKKGWPGFCHPTTGEDFACE